MFAITGITGQVGGATARALLERQLGVRAVLRDPAKAAMWKRRGAQVALADFVNTEALRDAFSGVEGVFVMIPPIWDPAPEYPEARAMAATLRRALEAAAPPKIVCLSSIGAQHASGLGLITQLFLLERELRRLPMPSAFLRAAWFMENAMADISAGRSSGVIPSYLSPLDGELPMVATADVGAVAADVLTQQWEGNRIVEIEGPRPYAPNDVAAVLRALLQRPVRAEVVARNTWAARFRGQGYTDPLPRIKMLDGFNSGWIAFEGPPRERIAGSTTLDAVLAPMIHESADAA